MSRYDDHPGHASGGGRALTTLGKSLWATLCLAMGLGAAVYLHWPALTNPVDYKSDVRQSPHWAAYHTDTFRDDDLLLDLAAYNESPVQNLIYFIGTYAVDMVTLGKWLAVVGYGLTSALFFWIGHSMLGLRGGVLASFFFTFCPDQFEYFAGGFSKAWMIPLLLVLVYALERKAWNWLVVLLPVGAAAYPVSSVLMGGVALTCLVLEAPREWARVLPPLIMLSVASALAVGVLLVKYAWPPEGVGALTPGSVLREMPEMYFGGMWPYLPLPTLTAELTRRFAHPFTLFSVIVFFLFLGRQGIAWSRSLTALFLASVVFFLLAEAVWMHLYQPNRYTRYSFAVLLALWHAMNWDRVLAAIPWRAVRAVALASLLGLGFYLFQDTFRIGKDTSNREDRVPLSTFLASLPAKVLIAGHPEYMDDVPILARRSVLCNYKLAHPWYSDYYREIRRRTEATFEALYASEPQAVNRLADEWGVTHLVVVKRHLGRPDLEAGGIYVDPYNDFIERLVESNDRFLLSEPPAANVVFRNRELYVIELPLR